ncbi:MAG: lipopolysaccharide biosynthesis protein [Monoglobales bacterium]
MKNDLKKQIISGLFWKFGERIFAQGVSFIVSLVLARMLLPEEYGIVALVLVFINLANVFVTNGLGETLIQKPNATQRDFSTMFFCSLFLSIILYIFLFCSAPFIAKFYNNVQLILILRVLGLQVPLSSVNTIQQAYVSKHMMFRKFFYSTMGGTLVSGVIGIALAYNGAGIWALVVQYMTNTVINTCILFVTVRWYPTLEFDRGSAKTLFSFGWKLVAAQFMNQVYVESKNLFIGKIYTPADLASYNKGEQFPSVLVMNINSAISSVLFPAMSIANNEKGKLKELTRKSVMMSSYIVFPIVTGLMIVAEPMIRLLLTDRWISCVPFLQISCLFWMFQPSQTANVQAIKAAGRSDICLKLEMIKKAIGVTLLLIAIQISPLAVAIMNAVFAGISALLNILPNRKLIGYGIGEQVKDILPSLILAIIMYILVSPIVKIGCSDIITIFLQICLGIIVYTIGSYVLKIDAFFSILNLIKKK